MSQIPQRLYYPIKEAADLLGVSTQYVYDEIKRSRRTGTPIPTRTFGNRLRVHRSYLFPEEPVNVTPLRPAPITIATDQVADAIVDAIRRLASGAFSDQRKRSA